MRAYFPRHIRKVISSFFAMIVCTQAYSQSLSTEDGVLHWETGIRAGLNTDGYQFDIGIAYFPIQYVGLKAQIGVNGEIWELGDWITDDVEYYPDYAARFIFNPTFVFRSPRLVHWKRQDAWFHIFAEPGISISPGAVGSKNPQIINWDLKAGVNMQLDRAVFTLGYGISNFNLYSGHPDNHWGMPDKDNYLTHSVFLGGAYKF